MYLTNDHIRQLYILIDLYLILKDRADESGMAAWRERVKETFPYETDAMLVKIKEIEKTGMKELILFLLERYPDTERRSSHEYHE